MEEAYVKYHVIQAWWLLLETTTEDGMYSLSEWLELWHYRYRQWGGHMLIVGVLRNQNFHLHHISMFQPCFTTLLLYLLYIVYCKIQYWSIVPRCLLTISLKQCISGYNIHVTKWYASTKQQWWHDPSIHTNRKIPFVAERQIFQDMA